MVNKNNSKIFIPLIISISLVLGMVIGRIFTETSFYSPSNKKLAQIFRLIEDKYVDTVSIDTILEKSFPNIVAQLDPHSTYIPAEDLAATNEELEGSFSGIGISFSIMNDTIAIIEVIPTGPSEKVGLMAGDRIVSVNNENVAGISITNEKVMKLLRGKKGTKLTLGIKRNSSATPLSFDIVRGDIPVHSIDASYLITPEIGYIKVNKFSRNTYNEFLTSLNNLKNEGASKYIIDLRGNGGGIMESAILMANEFLPKRHVIVNTRSRYDSQSTGSDGNGSFQNAELVVLIDEFSASASEIFAGAIQDHDRGLIIGRRSFGKGLVQQQILLSDSSAVRLTVARYYTPSGRCIQKDYKLGDKNYNNELIERFNHGEAYNADSIKLDKNLEFTTAHGRKVYGGGGIMPDIFVANDTSGITKYYYSVINAGLFQKFAFNFCDKNRNKYNDCKSTKELLKRLPNDDYLLSEFVDFAKKNKVPAQWYYISISRPLILPAIKALIARDFIGSHAYYEVYNNYDNNIKKAIEQINKGASKFPIQLDKK